MKQCKPSAGNDLESFWILMKLDKHGAVKEVLLHRASKMDTCARERLLKSAFSPLRANITWTVLVPLINEQ